MLSTINKTMIKDFFNTQGYVMDFSSKEFDDFTNDEIGYPISKEFPNLSKGKALESYIDTKSDKEVIKFTKSLLEYFDKIYYDKNRVLNDEHNLNQYNIIKKLLKQYPHNQTFDKKLLNNNFPKNINSKEIKDELNRLFNNINQDPAATIGNSKDLLESIYKHILDYMNISYNSKHDDMNQLTKKIQNALKLNPKLSNNNVYKGKEIGNASSKILGSLSQIVNQLTFIRNKFGTGHGRSSKQPIIPKRYALLCLGSTATIIRFLIDTFENRKNN